jgi:ribonucleoside-diphosphate reductase alpha chain
MCAGHQKKGVKAFLSSLVHARETDTVELAVLKEVRGDMNEYQDCGQNSGDAGGSHSDEIITSLFAMTGAALDPVAKKEYASAEKTACSIEAMHNGGECEACQ